MAKPISVVITAMGIVSPLGFDVEEFRRNLFEGASGVKPVEGTGKHLGPTFPVPYAAMIDKSRLDKEAKALSKNGEIAKFIPESAKAAYVATKKALEGLDGVKIDKVIYGAAEGITDEHIRRSRDEKDVNYLKDCRPERALEAINMAIKESTGSVIAEEDLITLNSACATSNHALVFALHQIRAGLCERVLVGGVDVRATASNMMNFNILGALCTEKVDPAKASRPFSADRAGFIRGEGAGSLLLETEASAKARGAKILAYLAGGANTSDAYRITDGRDDGKAVIECINTALKDADLTAENVDAINAHGTSTKLNDRVETFCIKEVFGTRAPKIPINSIKSQIGHSTVAAGAQEAIACVLMLQAQRMSATINYNQADPECDLDYVPNTARDVKMEAILSNNFGFGGQNSCVVFKRYSA
jgi:3-oxoacyl-[acyl-carrier-protein] synthase II